jgi:large subunit ribosomal protein L20
MHGLKLAGIDLDRKVLADLAVNQPEAFTAVTVQAKNALENKESARAAA